MESDSEPAAGVPDSGPASLAVPADAAGAAATALDDKTQAEAPQSLGGGVTIAKTKVDILLKPAGDAPILKKKNWAVERSKKLSYVVDFTSKYLKLTPDETLFFYVSQCFAPAPDAELGPLYDCFGSDGKLVLHYCKTQAWG